MEIFWYGHSCFRLVERGKASVVTDPFDSTIAGYPPLKLKSEIVTVSCDDPVHNYVKAVKGDPFLINGPAHRALSQSTRLWAHPPRRGWRSDRHC